MPLPSFHVSGESQRAWNVARAGTCGAGIGALAALFKTFAPLRGAGLTGESSAANLVEIAGAALAFALLCGGAAVLRNFVARRLIWRR